MVDRPEKTLHVAHPWHGVSPGDGAPATVNAFVELVPTDTVKYEIDKSSGLLRIDRPQRFSSLCPTLYGFIPQTYCGETTAARCMEKVHRTGIRGDGDPLDVCILTEKSIPKGGFLASVRPIGGLRMLDGDEADDKIIAVLVGDVTYGSAADVSAIPSGVIDRLRHYFLSYKQFPGETLRKVEIAEVYGRDEALIVLERSLADYRVAFP